MPDRFDIPAHNLRSSEVNAEIAEARMAIRRAKKKAMDCSEACVLQDDLARHASDCPNRDRYDVV